MDRSHTFISFAATVALFLLLSPVSIVNADQTAVGHETAVADQPGSADHTADAEPVASSGPQAAQDGTDLSDPDENTDAASSADESTVAAEPNSYIKLTGRIRRAKSGFVFVRTPVGRLTLFSDKGLHNAKAGQMVTLWTQERNIVVDLHKKGEATPIRRFITGVPAYTSPEQTEIHLWTPDGGQTISLAGENSTLTTIEEGTPITVQLNQAGEVISLAQLSIDIEISNSTKKRQGNMLKLAGTVSKVKAGFAFVETPIGVLTLSKNTGLRNAKSGQEVTVWLNDHHLVIDVREEGEPAFRYVTGKVVYASGDKQEIKLWTPEGEKTISLPPAKKKRRPYREGTPITVQLNGSGEVIDVRKVR